MHYHVSERQRLQDVLAAIRHGCTFAGLVERQFPTTERLLKSPAEMGTLITESPEATAHSVEIADHCPVLAR